MKYFVLKTLLIVSGIGQNCQKCGSSLKKKVFSLPKLATGMAPISASKTIFLGEFYHFLSFLCIWGPKNNFWPPKKFELHWASPNLYLEVRNQVFLGLNCWYISMARTSSGHVCCLIFSGISTFPLHSKWTSKKCTWHPNSSSVFFPKESGAISRLPETPPNNNPDEICFICVPRLFL